MEVIKNNNQRNIKSLLLLFIGEVLTVSGLLCALASLFRPFIFLALLSLAGVIVMLIGVIRLCRVNKFFLIALISFCLTIAVAVTGFILDFARANNDAIAKYGSITSVIDKGLSMVFTFGVIRGCSKVATGKANTRFANIMTIANIAGKGVSILFTVLSSLYYEKNPDLANAFVIVTTIVAMGAEVFFIVYLYRAYLKAKKSYEKRIS